MPEGWMIRARAERRLAHLANYQNISQDPSPTLARLPGVTLREGEDALGIYENTPGQLHEMILVTTYGFHVYFEPVWEIIDSPYAAR